MYIHESVGLNPIAVPERNPIIIFTVKLLELSP
jgi:hypothetical protein